MATLPGRCGNQMFCSLAATGRLINVPADGPFVCPNCGKVLQSPAVHGRRGPWRPAWRGTLLLLVILAAFAGGALVGGHVAWPPAGNAAAMP